jgi:hypothetical protein
LSGLRIVETSGSCAMTYQNLAALYFDRSIGAEQQTAFMKLLASFFSGGTADFPYVRSVPIDDRVTEGHLFSISIPDILELRVDRNWGQASPPFSEVAACDHYSNIVQDAQNIRYRMRDPQARLDFDYSRRQANYRRVSLGVEQYRAKSLLIQFIDGAGWFNQAQLRLIDEQHLALPDLNAMRERVSHLLLPRGGDD